MSKVDDATRDAFTRILYDRWEPLSWQIADEYELSDLSVSKVKRNLKRRFAGEGIVWGYDPDVNRFIAAPNASVAVQQRIITHGAKSAASSTAGLMDQVRGAYTSGTVSRGAKDKALRGLRDARKKIKDMPTALDFAEAVAL